MKLLIWGYVRLNMLTMKEIKVVGAIFTKDGKYLAARRKMEKSAGGLWEFPGGKVELHEHPENALVREIREELTVEISVEKLLTRCSTRVGKNVIDLAVYFVEPVEDYPVSSQDHDLLLWLSTSELLTLEWAKPDLPAVRILAGEEQMALQIPNEPN
jgi:8-oxo-dGTP diphosphatase